jgi:hypothetical protein
MKKAALTVVIVASLSAGAAMAAEPFNDRGIDYVSTVQTDTSVQRESVTAQVNGFNNRGIDYIDATAVSSDTPRSDVSIAIKGFNDRHHVALSNARQGLSNADRDVRIGYSD